jgi:hypothetical protein
MVAMTRNTTAHWAKQIRTIWQATAQSFIKIGQLLIDAKKDLGYGKFGQMVANDLPFGSSEADRLMKIARDKRLTNPAHAQYLPPSSYHLYRLTFLSNAEFAAGIADGTIKPDMERRTIEAVVTKHTQTIVSPCYVHTPERQPAKTITVGVSRPQKLHFVEGKLLPSPEPASDTRRQAQRVIDSLEQAEESLELAKELLADEAIAEEVAELLRTRGENRFRMCRVLQAFLDLRTAIDSASCVQ